MKEEILMSWYMEMCLGFVCKLRYTKEPKGTKKFLTHAFLS